MTLRHAVRLLDARGETPVLFDVGASAGSFKPFARLLPVATYVGFDADFVGTEAVQGAKRFVLLNRLVREAAAGPAVTLHITRNPTCSSTLEPDEARLRHYAHGHRFEVLRTETQGVTTLDAVLDEQRLDRIDWLKLDTQGTDLRIVLDLSPPRFAQLLCVDVEPGFDAYYSGEDTFGATHAALTARGFFLAHAVPQGAPRLARDVAARRLGLRSRLGLYLADRTLPPSPTAIEARYLRTVESMEGASAGAWLRLYACAAASGLDGYALEIADRFAQAFPADNAARLLLDAATARARWRLVRDAWRLWRQVSPAKLKRLLRGG
jgi:FkbM family methyltransferase